MGTAYEKQRLQPRLSKESGEHSKKGIGRCRHLRIEQGPGSKGRSRPLAGHPYKRRGGGPPAKGYDNKKHRSEVRVGANVHLWDPPRGVKSV